jgi:hypothetical protein
MIPDNLLINLKILSKIQKNGRIARSFDGIIGLETDAYYQSFKRFVSSDSRKQAVFEINSIISECINVLNGILNSKYMSKTYCQSDEFRKNCEELELLISTLELARNGIENLKFTYQNDQNTVSQLDVIILKINTNIKDITQKIHYYRGFIPQPPVSIIDLNTHTYTNYTSPQHNSYNDRPPLEPEQHHYDLTLEQMSQLDNTSDRI